jgi:hypothetical protein
MAALVQIDDVYKRPFGRRSSRISYLNSEEFDILGLEDVISGIEEVVSQKKRQMDLTGIDPLKFTQPQRDELNALVKADTVWMALLHNVVGRFAPGFDDDEALLRAINRTWFNSTVFFSSGDSYDPASDRLVVNGSSSHSYITQMLGNKLLPDFGYGSVSVMNLLVSQDCIVLGLRDGASLAHTVMAMPAGSAAFHTGRNPLFESMSHEYAEETGLEKKHIESMKLIGKMSGHEIGMAPHYVFLTYANCSISHVIESWLENAADRGEHRFLIPLSTKPNLILEELARNSFDPAKADDKVKSRITMGNVNTILGQCGGALVCYLLHKEGVGWLEEGLKRYGLDEKYLLSSRLVEYQR